MAAVPIAQDRPVVPKPAAAPIRHRSGARERIQLALVVLVALAGIAGIVAAGYRAHSVNLTGETANSDLGTRVAPADTSAIFVGQPPDEPVAVATYSVADLAHWNSIPGTISSGLDKEGAEATDDPQRMHLYMSGKIVLVSPGTHALVLSRLGVYRRVKILDGVHVGTIGLANADDIQSPAELASGSTQ